MTKLNSAGVTYARSLINAGKVNKTAAWSFSAGDGNALLGDGGDWENYGKAHLGIDPEEADKTKAHWKYPFAKGGTLYRSALTAIRQRAGQQNDTGVFDAAGSLLEKIDGEKNSQVATIERRAVVGDAALVKDGSSIRVKGHAAVFNQVADIGGFFREQIMPGAFARAILEDDVPFLIEHDGLPLARNTSGTLALSEDNKGLLIESQLDPADPDVQRIVPKLERGDLSKMSFGFRAVKESWDESGDIPLRTLQEVRLFDVSIVTCPAYAGTDIGLRSLDRWRAERERERSRRNFSAAAMRVRLNKQFDLHQRARAR